jgi:hypothetical protein
MKPLTWKLLTNQIRASLNEMGMCSRWSLYRERQAQDRSLKVRLSEDSTSLPDEHYLASSVSIINKSLPGIRQAFDFVLTGKAIIRLWTQ